MSELLDAGRRLFIEAQLPTNTGNIAVDLLERAFRDVWTHKTQKWREDASKAIEVDLWRPLKGDLDLELLDPEHTVDHDSFMDEFLTKNRIADIQNSFEDLCACIPSEGGIIYASNIVSHMRFMGLDPSQPNAFKTIGLDYQEFHRKLAKSCAVIEEHLQRKDDSSINSSIFARSLSDRFNSARKGLWYGMAGSLNHSNNLAVLDAYTEGRGYGFSLSALKMDGRALLHKVLG